MNPHLFTHTSVHLSSLCYAVAVSLRLLNRRPNPGLQSWVDRLWSAGCLLLWVHVVGVWQTIHGGSWHAAWEHTTRETAAATGVESGIGLWFNFLTLGLWTADCVSRLRDANDQVGQATSESGAHHSALHRSGGMAAQRRWVPRVHVVSGDGDLLAFLVAVRWPGSHVVAAGAGVVARGTEFRRHALSGLPSG